jgi:hypothetical protein
MLHAEKCEMTDDKFCVSLVQIPATLAYLHFQH